MTRTMPEVREWATRVLASSLYYSTCMYMGRDNAHFDAMAPADRYPYIAQAQALLAAHQ